MKGSICNIILGIFVLIFLPNIGVSQCSIDSSIEIIDDGESGGQILVLGAANNDLSSSDQCVAQIDIQFEHLFIGDVNVTLTSPAGQTIRLIGRAVAVSSPTQNINWDISFVPCDSTAIPPSGIAGVWDNEADWEIFTNYFGTFHPNQGCLEDFNVGSVDGAWTINVEDISSFGSGSISGFTITFCDGTSIECDNCRPEIPIIDNGDELICRGDLLPLDLNPVFPANYVIDQEAYFHGYTIFNQGEILRYDSTLFIDDLLVGSYQICPLTYNRNFIDQIPSEGDVHTPSSLVTFLSDNNICGVAGEDCYTISILEAPMIQRVELSACIGETVEYQGKSYLSSQIDTLYKSGPACDSLEIVTIEIINPIAQFRQADPQLNCVDRSIFLSLNRSLYENASTNFEWSTIGGNIVRDDGDSILVNGAGQYKVVIDDRGCLDSTTVIVNSDDTQPDVEIIMDTLNCAITSTKIYGISNVPMDTYFWKFPDNSELTQDTISTSQTGLYTVTGVSNNGCVSVQSFEVLIDTFLQRPSYDNAIVTCLTGSIDIVPSSNFDEDYLYSWTGPVVSNDFTIRDVDLAGDYKLIYQAENNCKDSLVVVVDDQRIFPTLDITLPIVTCEEGPFVASFVASEAVVSATWTNTQTGSSIDGDIVDLLEAGPYLISVTTDEGCLFDTMVVVMPDTNVIDYTAIGGVLDCSIDSFRLSLVEDITGVDFQWSGPAGYNRSEAFPFVSLEGDYTLIATFSNACTSETTVTIDKSVDKPNVDFAISPITCLRDTASISVSRKDFNYTWSSNILSINADSFRTDQSGFVDVIVVDPGSSCQAIERLLIEDRTEGAEFELTAEILNCVTDSVQVILSTEDSISSFTWEGVQSEYINDLSPFVKTAGLKTITVIDPYGCETIDSILILQDGVLPNPVIDTISFHCGDEEVPLTYVNTSTTLDSVLWTGPGTFNSKMDRALIQEGGVYTITAFGSNGCIGTDQLVVLFDTISPSVKLQNIDTLTCLSQNIEVQLDSINIFSIEWERNSIDIVGNAANLLIDEDGQYAVTVIGDNNCEQDTSFEIISLVEFPEVQVLIDEKDCDTDTATLIASSQLQNVSYVWAPENENVTGDTFQSINDGTYLLQATSDQGCVDSTLHMIVGNFTLPNIGLELQDTLSCNDPLVFITGVDLDNKYDWTFEEGDKAVGDTIFVSKSGIYKVQVEGRNGCIDSTEIFVPADTTLLTLDFLADTLTCDSAKVNIEVFGNTNVVTADWTGPFDFSSNKFDPIVIFPGFYTVMAEGENGCVSIDSVEVVLNDYSPEFVVDYATLPCDDAGTNLTVSSADEIVRCRWFGPDGFFQETQSPFVTTPGRYIAICNTVTGCPSRDTFILTYDTLVPLFDAFAEVFICGKDEVNLTSVDTEDDLEANWLGPNGFDEDGAQITTNTPGIYQLIVTGQNLCKDTLDVEVIDDRVLPQVSINQLDSLICENVEVQLFAIAMDSVDGAVFSYQWAGPNILGSSDGMNIVAGEAGAYQVEVMNSRNNCRSVVPYFVEQLPPSELDVFTQLQDPTCEGFTNGVIAIDSVVGGSSPYLYSFNGKVFSETLEFPFLAGGVEHSVVVKDKFGCVEELLITLNEGQNPVIELPDDMELRLGDSLLVEINFMNDPSLIEEILWESTFELECDTCVENLIYPFENTIINVTVIDENGCSDSDEIQVNVKRVVDFKLANVISTNGNVENSIFFIPQITGVQQVNYFKIFSRRGNLVHSQINFPTGDSSFGWDGRFNGSFALSGVYAYIIELMYDDGRKVLVHGDLTLMR